MLILTRKVEQAIVINRNVLVRVLSIDGERVKLGVDAPRSISVLREELLAEVAGENRQAAAYSTSGADHLRRLRPPSPPK
jgi:carbon storage regulator